MNKHHRILSPRRRRGRRALALAFALALPLSVLACDVEWGGIEVRVHEPVYERPETTTVADTVRLPPLVMPTGPVVFHVRRTSVAGDAELRAIAEVSDSALIEIGPRRAERAEEYIEEFGERYLDRDRPYILFRDGARVGTFYVRAPWVDGTGLCAVLGADGRVELRPRLDTLSEFLAWTPGMREASASYSAPEYRDNMPELAQVLARDGIRRAGYPSEWRLGVPSDLRALDVGRGPVGFAATFMVGDTLAASPPSDSAGMAFMVTDFDSGRGYFPLFFAAEWYGPGGKRALRWVDAADVVGDTAREYVLQAYGDRQSWYEVVGLLEGERSVVWSSRRPVCEASEPVAGRVPG